MSIFQENLKDLSSEVSDFVFAEANKKLNSVNLSKETLDKKSFTICTILLSILGFVVSFTTKDIVETQFIIPYAILIVGFSISFGFLVKAVSTKAYYGDSFKPSQILSAEKDYLKDKTTLVNGFLINWYDHAIEKNLKLNTKRGFFINIALLLSLISLSTFIASYVWLKIYL